MEENLAEEDDDEGFGEFKFVLNHSSETFSSNQNNARDLTFDDDDWGDFVDNNSSQFPNMVEKPLQFEVFNGVSHTQSPPITSRVLPLLDPIDCFSDHSTKPTVEKQFEKPKGALPLSLFGDVEEEEEESGVAGSSTDDAAGFFTNQQVDTVETKSSLPPDAALKDIIINLYNQKEQGEAERSNFSGLNALEKDLVNGNDAYDDEDSWEFKDASSKEPGVSELEPEVEVMTANQEMQVDRVGQEKFEGALCTSNIDNGIHGLSDFFIMSNVSVYKSDQNDGYKPSTVAQIGVITNSYSHDQKSETADKGFSYLIDENDDFDGNSWKFKDAVPESGSKHKEEQKVAEIAHSGSGMLTSDGVVQFQLNSLQSEDHKDLPESIFSSARADSDNAFNLQDISISRTSTSIRNETQSQPSSVSLNDLILNLYSVSDKIPVDSTSKATGNGKDSAQTFFGSDLIDDVDDDSWEFKDAVSEMKVEVQKTSISSIGDSLKTSPTKSKLKVYTDFYCKLKAELCFIALCHLETLKKAEDVDARTGKDAKAVAVNEEIQTIYKELQEDCMLSEELFSDKQPTRSICLDEILNVLHAPDFHVLDSEYSLSHRVSLAKEDVKSAVELLKHASTTLKILTLGSTEEQTNYVSKWSKIISVCSQELKHGALIWKQSLQKNLQSQVLSESQGRQFILALGEIYRVVEVIGASAKVFKPWILLSFEDSIGFFSRLEECYTLWSSSGLEEALSRLSDPDGFQYHGTIKALLASFKHVHDLDVGALQNQVLAQREPICQLSMFSAFILPDMEMVVWDGEYYFLTLANLWANLISCNPPKLPRIQIG